MPPIRLPSVADLPDVLKPVLHPSVSSLSALSNVVIFLPGLGDTAANFSSFARALNLPDTLTITLQAPHPLPFPIGPGFHWSDDLQVDSTDGGSIDATESGFSSALGLVGGVVIRDILIKKCGFNPAGIHLFGYRQGGSLALSIPLHPSMSSGSLGGVISLGGYLPLSTPLTPTNAPRCKTPVLVVGGSNGVIFKVADDTKVARIQDRFEVVEAVKWKKLDDSMPANREEVWPLMAFWGRRLRSTRGVPKGANEIF